jgi:hypothetical protein
MSRAEALTQEAGVERVPVIGLYGVSWYLSFKTIKGSVVLRLTDSTVAEKGGFL